MKNRIAKILSLVLCLVMAVSVLPVSALAAAGDEENPTSYTVTVLGGEGSGKYAAGQRVTIEATEPGDADSFSRWVVITENAKVNFANVYNEKTSFIMPEKNVTVKPLYNYKVTVKGGEYASLANNRTEYIFEEGDEVGIKAEDNGCNYFEKWVVVKGGAKLSNSTRDNTSFVMPGKEVVVEAKFTEKHEYNIKDLCRHCGAHMIYEIEEVVLEVPAVKPAVGAEVFAPTKVLSVNDSDEKKELAFVSEEIFSSWYYSTENSKVSNLYSVYEKTTFDTGYAYNLFVSLDAGAYSKFASDCTLTLRTADKKEVKGTLLRIDADCECVEYDFFFDVLGSTTTTTPTTSSSDTTSSSTNPTTSSTDVTTPTSSTSSTTSSTKPTTASTSVNRLFGDNRYGTAIDISEEGWDKADTVILASGEKYPDALAGTVLAKVKNAPVLLTEKDQLKTETLLEMQRLGAKKIIILGGEDAVSKKIADSLSKTYTVERVAGENRNDTAAKIALAVTDKSTEAFIVSNKAFADALSAGSAAALSGTPILYANPDGTLPKETVDVLKTLGVTKAYIIGGEAAVDPRITAELKDIGITEKRLAGKTRYDTAIAVYNEFWKLFKTGNVAIATGKNYPDALAGVSFAARNSMPIFLVGDKAIDALTAGIPQMNVKTLYVFGGEKVVTDDVVNSLVKK